MKDSNLIGDAISRVDAIFVGFQGQSRVEVPLKYNSHRLYSLTDNLEQESSWGCQMYFQNFPWSPNSAFIAVTDKILGTCPAGKLKMEIDRHHYCYVAGQCEQKMETALLKSVQKKSDLNLEIRKIHQSYEPEVFQTRG